METKINIAEILKDKPKDTKLYSSICGKCELKEVDDKSFKISFYSSKFGFMNGGGGTFDKNGNLYDDGECVIFPSKEMRDWSKFAWKRGDVLVSNDKNTHIVFKEFQDDTYKTFIGNYYFENSQHSFLEKTFETKDFCKEIDSEAKTYINFLEKIVGGKLVLETLEIEKTQPEFKNGDIAYADYGNKQAVFIVSGKTDLSEGYNSFIALDLRGTLDMGRRMRFFKEELCKLRLATEEEKQQLFDALAKEGKAWDAEKKEVINLKAKVEFKPFEKVLVRDGKDEIWEPAFFSFYLSANGYSYQTIGGEWRVYCIPYEGNESLLGTTKDV